MRAKAAAALTSARMARSEPWASVAHAALSGGASPAALRRELRQAATRGRCDDTAARAVAGISGEHTVELLKWCGPAVVRAAARKNAAAGTAAWAARSVDKTAAARWAVAAAGRRDRSRLQAAGSAASAPVMLTRLGSGTDKSLRKRVATNPSCPLMLQRHLSCTTSAG